MILQRVENPDFLSNAYLIIDAPGGKGVLVDSNDVTDPLVERVDREGTEITHLLLTHHHWDHTWGACAWPDVTVIAHSSAVDLLAKEAERPWSHRYLHDQVEADPKLGPSFRARALAVPDWTDFRIVLPDETFDDALTLPDDVVLRHVGGNHAPDSIIVLADGVALLGDAFYPPPYHLRTPDDTVDYAMIKQLLSERHDWYVDAHSPPRRLSEALAQSG